jgi:hypothetical protein
MLKLRLFCLEQTIVSLVYSMAVNSYDADK